MKEIMIRNINKNTKLPNYVADLHPHARTLLPPCFIDPTRFLELSFKKFKIDSKLIGMADNSTILVAMGL
ncbi:UNVERIFIED_CONTAM: hypothetical protein NCL1_41074 [Trichonephila clavipes]